MKGSLPMIKSMTGFGRCRTVLHGREISVEIKSVNHRFFEFSCRTPKGYGFLDDKLKALVNSRVSRGKIDMFVTVGAAEDTPAEVKINHSLVSGYINAMKEISETYGIENDVTVTAISRFPDVYTVSKAPENEEEITADVLEAANTAIDGFIAMREAEGEKMKADILGRAEVILATVDEIDERSPQTVKEYEERLLDRINRTLQDYNINIDEQRVLTEVAVFADKVAVAEETVRLRSHFAQLSKIMESQTPIGREIDFIIQEMNREANTILSKANSLDVSDKAIQLKTDIEKVREQIQNLE